MSNAKIEFVRNKETGLLEAYKNGKKCGAVITMGDNIGPQKMPDPENKTRNEASR